MTNLDLCKSWPCGQMLYAKPESIRENEMDNIFWDLEMQTELPIPARRPYLILVKRKELNFAVPVEWKIKENKEIDKYMDLFKSWKSYGISGVTIIPIVFGAICNGIQIHGKWNQRLDRGRIETIHSPELLKSGSIRRGVLETWEDLLLPSQQGKPGY